MTVGGYEHYQPEWSTVDAMREEARDAARFDTATYRRVGDRLIDVCDLPDEDES